MDQSGRLDVKLSTLRKLSLILKTRRLVESADVVDRQELQ
jgi:hypothetical protein